MFGAIQQKTLIKKYANADFANAKNAKFILHKHVKTRKNTARAANFRIFFYNYKINAYEQLQFYLVKKIVIHK